MTEREPNMHVHVQEGRSSSSIATELLESRRSRAHFLTGAAAAAAAFGLAPGIASAAKMSAALDKKGLMAESPSTILNIAATAESAAVTALYHVHLAVNQNRLSVDGVKVPVPTLVSIVRAALREEQDHLAFIVGAGGKPLYTSFTFPQAIFTRAIDTLTFFEEAETVFIAAYMAATREFANGGHGKLAQYTFQIGGTECEHRTLMRAGLGHMPANNKSFETNLFGRVAGAATTLERLGIFKPGLDYPGGAAVDSLLATTVSRDRNAGVSQRKP
ncbi:MAG TPA: hypothetical protein VKX16_09945 [Chloroflexota bacterium]|nr:hypothetical protein [Chloroflexota bacterium]